MTWRGFIGADLEPNPDWVHHDHIFSEWHDAWHWMIGMLKAWENDDCADCREDAEGELGSLLNQPDDTEWIGEVEGDTYAIVRQP
jgi:hypothetical protein